MTQPVLPPGISGRIAAAFQNNALTPLLAVVALLLGLFAVMVTPREEEPQNNVTTANVLIPFPEASSNDVQKMVAKPAEQVLGQTAGIDPTYSVARPGIAILTVRFKVDVPRTEALVRLYDVLNAQQEWLPRNLGTVSPIVKPNGIDDVPVAAITLWSKDATSAAELETVAHAVEADLKAVAGVREVQTICGPGKLVLIAVNPERMRARGVDFLNLKKTVAAANYGMPVGTVPQGNASINVTTRPSSSALSGTNKTWVEVLRP